MVGIGSKMAPIQKTYCEVSQHAYVVGMFVLGIFYYVIHLSWKSFVKSTYFLGKVGTCLRDFYLHRFVASHATCTAGLLPLGLDDLGINDCRI